MLEDTQLTTDMELSKALHTASITWTNSKSSEVFYKPFAQNSTKSTKNMMTWNKNMIRCNFIESWPLVGAFRSLLPTTSAESIRIANLSKNRLLWSRNVTFSFKRTGTVPVSNIRTQGYHVCWQALKRSQFLPAAFPFLPYPYLILSSFSSKNCARKGKLSLTISGHGRLVTSYYSNQPRVSFLISFFT